MARPEKSRHSQRLAEFIRDRRMELGMTQIELGEKLGYFQGNFISLIENGRARFPMERWEPFAESLQVPKHEFLRLVMEEQFPSAMEYVDFKDPAARGAKDEQG